MPAAERAHRNAVFIVRYEDLVRAPDEALREICDFVGIRYSSDMALGKGGFSPKYTEEQHVLIGKRVEFDRIDAWKNELSDKDIQLFEADTRDLLPMLGYQISQHSFRHIGRLERVRAVILDTLVAAMSRWKRERRLQKHLN